MATNYGNENGRWITINGRRVFIKDKNATKKKEVANKIFGKKEYTSKDIKKLEGFNQVRGYKLGRYYLLKQVGPWRNIWWINNKDEKPQIYEMGTFRQMDKYKNVILVNNYKEGIQKLIELANKKGGIKNGK